MSSTGRILPHVFRSWPGLLMITATLAGVPVAGSEFVGTAAASPLFLSPSTVGSPLGCEYGALTLCGDDHPLAAADETGETTLVWNTNVGRVTSIQAATIPAGGTAAGPARTLSRGLSALAPALALASSGRGAIAWFELRPMTRVAHSPLGVVAVQVSQHQPDGTFLPPETIWRAARPESFRRDPLNNPEGEGDIQIATDEAGDETVAWETTKLMVASRRAQSGFALATALPAIAEHDLPESIVPPAVAVDPAGRATILWTAWGRPTGEMTCTSTGCERSFASLLVESTWAAGEQPAPPVVVQEDQGPNEQHQIEYEALQLLVDRAGDELATWLNRPRRQYFRSEEPYSAVSVAWRPAGATFESPQILVATGLAVAEPHEVAPPAVTLNPDGHALVAWDEITRYVEIPGYKGSSTRIPITQVELTSAAPGSPFSAPTALAGAIGHAQQLAVSGLADGTAIIAGATKQTYLAAHLEPDGSVVAADEIQPIHGSLLEHTPTIAMPDGNTVLTWGDNESERPVQYAIGDGLVGRARPLVAPTLEGTRTLQDVYDQRGIDFVARCTERCRIDAIARLYSEHETRDGGRILTMIGSFPDLRRTLRPNHRTLLKIPASRYLLRLFCGAGEIALQFLLTAHGVHSGALQRITEGGPAEKSGDGERNGCPSTG